MEEDDSREESEVEADSDHEDESESQLSQWLGELENYAKVVYHVRPNKHTCLYGPRREKTCLQGFRQSEFQTSLLSYRD